MRTLVIAFCVLSAPAHASTWLCKVEDSAGYRWDPDEQAFQPQTFVTDDTYIIRPFNDADTNPDFSPVSPQYVVVELGTDDIQAYFYGDIETASGIRSMAGRFEAHFFVKTNELLISSFYDPLNFPKSDRTKQITPFFAIGKCSKI